MKIPETFFTKAEQERIEQAVVAAESKTSGEIVPMIVGASARYAEAELVGVVIGLIIGTIIELMWHDPWGPVHAYILWPMIGAISGYAASSIPSVKRRLLPRQRIAEAVHLRSLAAFAGRQERRRDAQEAKRKLEYLFHHSCDAIRDRFLPHIFPAARATVTNCRIKSSAKTSMNLSGEPISMIL